MRHYYTDQGILDYTPPDELLAQLTKFTPNNRENVEGRKYVRSLVCEHAAELMHEYDIHSTMGGMGGSQTLAEWKETNESSPLRTLLKKLMFDFVEQGYVPHEFLLAAWNTICSVQFDHCLGETP